MIQRDVNTLSTRVDKNSLMLNENKCKYMIILRLKCNSVPALALTLYGKPIEKVSYKYLGVVITDDLSWSTYIDQLTSKARRIVGLIY